MISFSCGFQYWAGINRYVWLDLNAKSVNFGPSMLGDGVVNAWNVPSLSHLNEKQKDQHQNLAISLGNNENELFSSFFFVRSNFLLFFFCFL
jgi:hypothetical protein